MTAAARHDFEHQQDLPPGASALRLSKAMDTDGPAAGEASQPVRTPLDVDTCVRGVLAGDRAILGRTITLVESHRADHQALARQVLAQLMPQTGKAFRVGITGVPGVGKSTFIEALGCHLTGKGHRVAVLAVDPSSGVTGGSILGDKTRMRMLSVDPHAFIRPSPAAGTLGGVARKTREIMLICEAAGYDVVLVETVGVGQSETVVADMTDCFLALMLAGAGDELQGIKRGLLELVDIIAVNKADGDNRRRAELAAEEYRHATHYIRPVHADWRTPVLTCSATEKIGIDAIWDTVVQHHDTLSRDGELERTRRQQMLRWMWAIVDEQLRDLLKSDPQVSSRLHALEAAIRDGTMAPTLAADELIATFLKQMRPNDTDRK